jgi:ribosomal protein S18 acetylase RimI-like enzyme
VAGSAPGEGLRLNATITIRRGGVRDHSFVLDLGRRTLETSVPEHRKPSPQALESSYERLLDFAFDRPHVLLIAESALEPLGFVLLLDGLPDEVTLEPQAFVAYMAVEPQARRQGVAAALLGAAEAEARARGRTHVAMMVTEENDAARELYAQAGYFTERRLLCKIL